jgi:GT2 family glycosyltransferase
MDLSIVITTRNRVDYLMNCIDSINKSSYNDKYELIVVDDNSTDPTKSINSDDLPVDDATIIRNSKQIMMVRSRNAGAKKTKGKYVLFIDDDNEIHSDMITQLVTFLNLNHNIGIAGPSMYYKGSKKPYCVSQKINLYTGKTVGLVSAHKNVLSSDGIPNVFIIRKIVLEELGYFDDRIVQTFTEPDFAFSARRLGIGCEIVVSAKTYHNKPYSSIGMQISNNSFTQKAYYLIRNRILFVSRYGKLREKIIFNVFFSWMWPLIYSLIAARYFRKDLIVLYWMGFVDGIKILLTGKIDSNELSIMRVKKIMSLNRIK